MESFVLANPIINMNNKILNVQVIKTGDRIALNLFNLFPMRKFFPEHLAFSQHNNPVSIRAKPSLDLAQGENQFSFSWVAMRQEGKIFAHGYWQSIAIKEVLESFHLDIGIHDQDN